MNKKTNTEKPMILMVEDDQDSVFYFTMVLRSDYDLESAESVDEAVEVIQRRVPALILLDLSLEGPQDGLDLVRMIRNDSKLKAIPIVAATAHALNQDRQNCLEAGCDDYLPKPIKMTTLRDTVRSLVAA